MCEIREDQDFELICEALIIVIVTERYAKMFNSYCSDLTILELSRDVCFKINVATSGVVPSASHISQDGFNSMGSK